MKNNSLEEFEGWSSRHGTHMDRHVSILNRQADVFKNYLAILRTHPVNSIEFYNEILALHNLIADLLGEMEEVNIAFIQDIDDFRLMLTTLKGEILGYHEE